MSDLAVEAIALSRTFRARRGPERVALDSIDLQLPAGGLHGLLGPNGAGKTTLCRIASTVLLPTAGVLRVDGLDVVRDAAQVRRRVGIVFGGDRGLYGRLTARENLDFWCAMYGFGRRDSRTRVPELLDRLGLARRGDELVETFSRGMKQRLHLARGLVSDPSVLLLDEPTVGMDPVSAHDFRNLAQELRSEGRTVVLTTHDMAEAQALCDTVTFIDDGRIVGSGTPRTVRAMLVEGGIRVRVHDVDEQAHAALLSKLVPAAPAVHDRAARHSDFVVADTAALERLVAVAAGRGHASITTGPPSLEDVYLRLLGQTHEGGRRGMTVS